MEQNLTQEQSQNQQSVERVVSSQDNYYDDKLIGLKELLKRTFSLIKKGFWKYVLINFIGVVIIPGILFLLSFLLLKVSDSFVWLALIIILIYYFVFWKQAVFISFVDKLNREERKIPFKKGFSFALGLLVFGIVFGIILNIGFLLLVIPGLIWMIKYWFTPYVYCFEEKKIFKAMGLTANYTKGFIFSLMARFLFFLLISIVASIILIILVFFLIPLAGTSLFGLITSLTSGGVDAILVAIPVIAIFILAYFVVFTLVEIFQVIYFYNIFDSLRNIKQRVWEENRQVTDNWKKDFGFIAIYNFSCFNYN